MAGGSRLPYVSVSDPSPAAEPLPRRAPPPEPGQEMPAPAAEPPRSADQLPQRAAKPVWPAEELPRRAAEPPRQVDELPRRGTQPPRQAEELPRRADELPRRPDELPQRGGALPRRTSRTRRSGRHRSPHRLTVPSDAPSLVLAVPGASCAASDELTSELAAAARLSCPGVDVRVGYLAGNVRRLEDALVFPEGNEDEHAPRAVVVPLLAGPHPDFDAVLARAVDQTSTPVMLASHLGPHPLLAAALHTRLAEAGLAREGRATGLSIVTSANGVLVLADRGDEAVQAAGVTAVLLAARLATPTAPASLGYPGSVESALARLRETGVSRPVVAPCVIGPETPPHELEIIRNRLDAPCAQPLAAHPAVAQLVVIRYGAALASLTMVG